MNTFKYSQSCTRLLKRDQNSAGVLDRIAQSTIGRVLNPASRSRPASAWLSDSIATAKIATLTV